MNRPARKVLSESAMKNVIGIPVNMVNATIADIDRFTPARERLELFVLDYIKNIHSNFENGQGIYFYGSNGAGKTFMACLILKEAYRNRYECRRVTFMDYCNTYTRVWDAGNLQEREELEERLYTNYKATEFLLLEEIGKGVENKATIPILEDLLRYREDRGLVTLFCSNLTPTQVKDLYGNSIYSLIMGHATSIKMEGKDRRRK